MRHPLRSYAARWLRQPQQIPERLVEKFLNRRAYHFYHSRTTTQNDAERRSVLVEWGGVDPYVEEARQLDVIRTLASPVQTDDPMMQTARAQTTSLDDCITMYVLVRLLQPERMVETGVFFGALSATILHAMERNGRGHLKSIDLPVEADGLNPSWRGGLVPDDLRHRWTLVLGDSRVELPRILREWSPVDAFNHDSLHTTRHMTWEFETAWPHVRPGGLLTSHDVLTTFSWNRFCRQHQAEIATCGRIFGLGLARKRDESNV